MKRWMLCLLATSSAAALAACSSGGGGGGTGLQGKLCSVPAQTQSLSAYASDTNSVELASALDNADPYETRGKVQIENLTADTFNAHYSAQSASRTSDNQMISAGTQLTVTMRDACSNPGLIAADIQTRNGMQPSTPAGIRSYRWVVPNEMSLQNMQDAADADECVVGISDLGIAKINADPKVLEQGHLAMLEAATANSIAASASGPQVVIAIIDTGFDMDHEDLKNVFWTNTGEIPGNGKDDDGNGYVDDVHGYNFASDTPNPNHQGSWGGRIHGTHVAGLAAAQAGNGLGVEGTSGGSARIMALNVFGKDPGAFSSDVANAIRYAADNGAEVINMSVGGVGKNAAYEAAIAYAIRKGATVFAAAGNERRELGSSYFLSPGGYGRQFAGAVAVGSVDSKDLDFSSFSNFSPTFVELAAPGAEDSSVSSSVGGVLSTWINDGYGRMRGTSMATPVAAGGAALAISMLKAKGYDPSPATVEGIVEVSAKRIEKLRTKIKDGRVMNLRAIAEYINNSYPKNSGAASDPGVPGFDACAVGTSK